MDERELRSRPEIAGTEEPVVTRPLRESLRLREKILVGSMATSFALGGLATFWTTGEGGVMKDHLFVRVYSSVLGGMIAAMFTFGTAIAVPAYYNIARRFFTRR